MASPFSRMTPALARTFALRRFNAYETEINQHFWSFKVISEFARYLAKERNNEDPTAKTAHVFKAGGPDAQRIPLTVSDWLMARDDLENWLRISALVSASAYLEVYLGQVIRSALMSWPLRRHGGERRLDGVRLLKEGVELPFEADAKAITKGDWNARIAGFTRLFGEPSSELVGLKGQLEKIRDVRNEFAHGFGRDLTIREPDVFHNDPPRQLTQEKLIKHLGTLSKTAAMIDKQLLKEQIGNFELLYYYHGWKSQHRHPGDEGLSEARALQKSFNRDNIKTVSEHFCAGLIDFYASA